MMKVYGQAGGISPMVEIGIAESVSIIEDRGNSQAYVGGGIRFDSSNPPDLCFHGWKTPVTTVPSQPLPQPGALPTFIDAVQSSVATSQEVRDRDIIICALVHMLGGSVTVSDHEAAQAFERVQRGELESYVVREPHFFVIKIKDPNES